MRFSDVGWTDIRATTALTSILLEGLGYQAEEEALSVPGSFVELQAGRVDAFLGAWLPTMAENLDPFVAQGTVEVLGVNLEGARFSLAVPTYLADHGLTDFTDIAAFGDALNHRILGIEPGNDGNRLAAALIGDRRFGLDGFEVVASSEQGMLDAVTSAIDAGQAVVFLAWEPHPMNTEFDLTYLDGGDEFFGPNHGASTVHTAIRAGYAEECPNASRLLANLVFSIDMENTLMGAVLDENQSPRDAALAWLLANPSALEPWLEGVETLDGAAGLLAVRSHLGL